MSKPYLEENLRLDYNHLESLRCFCQKPKDCGELFCPGCLDYMPAREIAELKSMHPGEGIANAAALTWSALERARAKWRAARP